MNILQKIITETENKDSVTIHSKGTVNTGFKVLSKLNSDSKAAINNIVTSSTSRNLYVSMAIAKNIVDVLFPIYKDNSSYNTDTITLKVVTEVVDVLNEIMSIDTEAVFTWVNKLWGICYNVNKKVYEDGSVIDINKVPLTNYPILDFFGITLLVAPSDIDKLCNEGDLLVRTYNDLSFIKGLTASYLNGDVV